MITLQQKKIGHHYLYVRIDTDAYGHEVLVRECDLRVLQTKIDRQIFFILLDGNGATNLRFHQYVNLWMIENRRGVNSRRKAASALCKLFSFCALMDYEVNALDATEINQFVTFLVGEGRLQCSNETVNSYLSIIRHFFKTLEIRCDAIFNQHNTLSNNALASGFQTMAYDVNLPTDPHKREKAPKYISLDYYIRLIEIAQSKGDWTGVMLMHLMFRYGMRLGECLGLTEEDIVVYKIKGQDVWTLIVRNRLSDEPWQHAKRKLIPLKEVDYDAKPYIDQWRDDDYAHYYLTESGDFVEAFKRFVRISKETAERNYPENYKSCEADIVYPQTFRGEKNRYIFQNRLGKRLSAQVWGKRLKEYFVEARIPFDVDKKDSNLSHRFRHGFAMMHARYMDPPTPPHELQKMMHHRHLSSTLIYYNPTLEDEFDYKTKLQNQLFDNNPRLRSILADFFKNE